MINAIRNYVRLVKRIEQAKREGRTDELRREFEAQQGQTEVLQTMMRPMRYETIDGAGEIGWGCALLCFALSGYMFILLEPSRWRTNLGWLLMLGACLAMPLCRWVIKRYITWPRTGYVAYRRDRKFWITIIVAACLAGVAGYVMPHLLEPEMKRRIQLDLSHGGLTNPGLTTSGAIPGELSAAGGVFLVVFVVSVNLLYLMLAGASIGKHRWKWLVLLLLVAGSIGIWLSVPGDYTERWRPLTLFYGLVSFFSGAATLISYLRHSKPPASEAE